MEQENSTQDEVFTEFLKPRRVLSPLRYPGGKRRLVPYLAAAMGSLDGPPELFVEPFVGGMSASLELLDKDLVQRVAIGDSDELIAAFWKTVFHDTDWICKRIESVDLDLETWKKFKSAKPTTQRDRALTCLYLNRTSFNGALHQAAGPIGGMAQASEYDIGCRFPRERLIKRIRACAELSDRVEMISKSDAMRTVRDARELAAENEWSTFFYFDPPFWAKANKLYRRSFDRDGHERLAQSISFIREPYILSYDTDQAIWDLYDELEDVLIAEIELLYSTGANQVAGRELIITNLEDLPAVSRLWRTKQEWKTTRRPSANKM